MRKKVIILLAAVLMSAICAHDSLASSERETAGLIKSLVVSSGAPYEIVVRDTNIRITGMLQKFYRNRNYMPAWTNNGIPSADIYSLIDSVDRAYEEGLKAEDYPVVQIESLANALSSTAVAGEPPTAGDAAALDVMATATYLAYAYHILAGRVYTEIMDGEWSDYIWEADLDKSLDEALEYGDIYGALKNLVPPHREYQDLRKALSEYRIIASTGGWTKVPSGAVMSLDYRGPRVALLRERLRATGDLDKSAAEDEYLFDDAVFDAVVRFQLRHGLRPDGIVGPLTLAVMNVPVENRIDQIELNMERWRWLPPDLGDRYIFINTAAFELKLVERGETVMKMRIVVGKPYWHTPSFSARMTYLVLNPSWNVPRRIAVDDIIPSVRKDPGYLSRQGFALISGWGEKERDVSPNDVDWSGISEGSLNFRFRQSPGPLNPLGRIKFMFPNRFNVYLHDTPSKGLFDQTVRTFSHGCIRIEDPLELADYLLPDISREEIASLIAQGKELEVPLPQPLTVHSLYWTAWVDRDGTLNFREDIYGRDEALLELLGEAPMTP